MRSVCSNCDVGLKRSDCTEQEYLRCECRRWMIEAIKQDSMSGFMHVLDEALEAVFENEKDLKRYKAGIINLLSKGLMD